MTEGDVLRRSHSEWGECFKRSLETDFQMQNWKVVGCYKLSASLKEAFPPPGNCKERSPLMIDIPEKSTKAPYERKNQKTKSKSFQSLSTFAVPYPCHPNLLILKAPETRAGKEETTSQCLPPKTGPGWGVQMFLIGRKLNFNVGLCWSY